MSDIVPERQPGVSLPINCFESIRHLLVNEEQPPTSDSNGLDFDRCAQLHNSIVRHGWISSGHSAESLPSTTWWDAPDHAIHRTAVSERLVPSIVNFLKRAIVPGDFPDEPKQNNFFYYVVSLAHPTLLFELIDGREIDLNHVKLYWTHDGSQESLTGIVYDQDTHQCIFDSREIPDYNPDDVLPCWQPLESILSVYINMIERNKVVALHKDIVEPDRWWCLLDGKIVDRDLHPDPPPNVDTATGATRRLRTNNPWTLVPFSRQDVEDTLQVWESLVQAIEDRRPAPKIGHPVEHGLFSENELRQAGLTEARFAWKFFRRARKPNFTFLGPGLRLPSAEELAANPFLAVQEQFSPELVPLPILCGDQTARNWLCYPFESISAVPWGLYFDACDPEGPSAFEDGIRLVLPYDIGANGYARTADGLGVRGHAELYQLGQNPFMPGHFSQLFAILWQFYVAVATRMWKVGADGVDESADTFKESDTDMAQWRDDETHIHPGYQLVLGPGDKFW